MDKKPTTQEIVDSYDAIVYHKAIKKAITTLSGLVSTLECLLPGGQPKPDVPAPGVDVPALVSRTWEWLKTNGGGEKEWKEFCTALDIKSSKEMSSEDYAKFADLVAVWVKENTVEY